MQFKCTCGMQFKSAIMLQVHLGFRAMRGKDNEQRHKPDKETRAWLDKYIEKNSGCLP